jgi:hypothetical protein
MRVPSVCVMPTYQVRRCMLSAVCSWCTFHRTHTSYHHSVTDAMQIVRRATQAIPPAQASARAAHRLLGRRALCTVALAPHELWLLVRCQHADAATAASGVRLRQLIDLDGCPPHNLACRRFRVRTSLHSSEASMHTQMTWSTAGQGAHTDLTATRMRTIGTNYEAVCAAGALTLTASAL